MTDEFEKKINEEEIIKDLNGICDECKKKEESVFSKFNSYRF
jgi:hypothetical protein